MPTRAKLTLDGFDGFLEELVRAGQDIDAIAGEALAAGADVLVEGMQRRAPYANIRRAISRSPVRSDGNKVYLYVGVLRESGPEIARIAMVWEYGGRDTPAKNRKPRPGILAHPYIRPTLRGDAAKAKAAMEAVFKRWLSE